MARRVGAGFGIGALFVIMLIALIVLPMLLSRFKMRAGFVDIGSSMTMSGAGLVRESESMFLPCRGVGGKPCPEGTFCDGATNACTPIAVAGV
jgi:hypothetical protein